MHKKYQVKIRDMETKSTTDSIHKFDPNVFDWEEWEILFNTHLAVKDVKDEIVKRNLLITSLDVLSFKTLISICKPKSPTDSSYEDLVKKLRSNYAKVTFPSTERIKFFALRQESSQSLPDFANILRNKATVCEFPAPFFEQALITAFVGGLKDEYVRKCLMQKKLDVFEETINLAKTMESVLKEGANVRGGNASNELVANKLRKSDKLELKSKQLTCSSCSSKEHSRSTCRFSQVIYRNCKKEGHIAKVCRAGKDKTMDITMKIDDFQIEFQLDTGSPITLINEETWVHMGKPNLEKCQLDLSSFTGHSIKLKGERMVNVQFNEQDKQLKLFVVSGYGTNVLGRDWIFVVEVEV